MLRAAGWGDATAIAAVQVTSWRAAYAGLLPAPYLRDLDARAAAVSWERLLRSPDPIVFVVESGGAVVGFASGGPEREGDALYRGELYAIYLLPDHQGRGHGRALTAAVASALAERRVRAMLVWVLRDNTAARAFYEAIGGRYLREHPLDIAGVSLPEVAYGWPDTSSLRAGPGAPR